MQPTEQDLIVVGVAVVGAAVGLAWLIALHARRRARSAEAARRSSEERLESICQHVPGVVYSYEVHPERGRTLLYMAPGLENLVGEQGAAATRARIDTIFDLVHPDDRERLRAAAAPGLAEGSLVDIELRLRRDDGGYRWVRSICRPIALESGGSRWHILLLDETERHGILDALGDSEQRFRTIVEDLPDLVCRFMPDTTISFVNEAYARYFGAPPAAFIGRSFLELVPPEQHDAIREHLASLGRAHTVKTMVHEVLAPSGERSWFEWTDRALLDGDGRVTGFQSVGRDVTGQRRAIEELERNRQLEALLFRELDHRVRNNLASLLSLIDITRVGAADLSTFAASIRGRIEMMTQVHDLLSEMQWEAITLRGLLNRLAPHEHRQRIQLEGPEMRVPARQAVALAMVYHELITNSSKHGALHDAGGTVRIVWRLDDGADSGVRLACEWIEAGGPRIQRDPKRGTGTSLIEGFVGAELRGSVTLRYPPEGARHSFLFRLDPDEQDRVESLMRPSLREVIVDPVARSALEELRS